MGYRTLWDYIRSNCENAGDSGLKFIGHVLSDSFSEAMR